LEHWYNVTQWAFKRWFWAGKSRQFRDPTPYQAVTIGCAIINHACARKICSKAAITQPQCIHRGWCSCKIIIAKVEAVGNAALPCGSGAVSLAGLALVSAFGYRVVRRNWFNTKAFTCIREWCSNGRFIQFNGQTLIVDQVRMVVSICWLLLFSVLRCDAHNFSVHSRHRTLSACYRWLSEHFRQHAMWCGRADWCSLPPTTIYQPFPVWIPSALGFANNSLLF
jgi:hypothetical protein